MEFYWLYGRTFEGSRSECVVELFIGPIVNAARGIANTVNNVLFSFAGNFMTALKPQITKSYAAGNYDYMFSLVERGSRYSYYILLLFTLPMLFETEFILTLWLKDYPEHTVNFVRLALLITMCDILSNTLINLQLATGKIRNYQLVGRWYVNDEFSSFLYLLKNEFSSGISVVRSISSSGMLSVITLVVFFVRW